MKNRDIKYYLETFDVSTLDSFENVLYNELRSKNSHRLSLLKLIAHHDPQSYALVELKELINQLDENIESYE